MSWVYNVKFSDEDKPRHFTAEKQLTVREIQERCNDNTLEWFNATRIDNDNQTSNRGTH